MSIMLDEIYLDQWEEIIGAVDKTHIPMRLINRIAINTDTATSENEINVMDLRRLGYDDDLIKEIVSETILELDTANTLDYFLDVDYIAKTAQVHTDLILRELH